MMGGSSLDTDNMDGGPGVDVLDGEDGDDNMVVGPDNDDLDGGDGIDNCDGGLVLTKTLMVIVKTRLITRPRK